MNNPMQMIQSLIGNPQQLGQNYSQFSKGITGDPQQIVMQKVQSGQITQQQLNMAQQIAPLIANALGMNK